MTPPQAALVLRGGRRVEVILAVMAVLGSLWFVGTVWWLAVEISSGATGTFDYYGVELPLWGVLALALPMAALMAWDSWTSRRVLRRGLVEMVVEGTGLQLVCPRQRGVEQELFVRPGEVVHIGATLVRRKRRTRERWYEFTVSTPAGVMRFTRSVFVERLSVAPLEEAAARHRITVVVHGAASAVGRVPQDRPWTHETPGAWGDGGLDRGGWGI